MITRRGLLGGMLGLVAAPAIVRVASLMPVKVPPLIRATELYGRSPGVEVLAPWVSLEAFDLGSQQWRKIVTGSASRAMHQGGAFAELSRLIVSARAEDTQNVRYRFVASEAARRSLDTEAGERMTIYDPSNDETILGAFRGIPIVNKSAT